MYKVLPEGGGSGLKAQPITQELVRPAQASWPLSLLPLHLSSVPGSSGVDTGRQEEKV